MPSVGTIRYRNGSSWIDILHPIGSFYFSTSSISPATLFGGTWTQITGAAIRGDTSTGYTGSDTHTLTTSEMPAHHHSNTLRTAWGSGDGGSEGFYEYRSFTSINSVWLNNTTDIGSSAAHSIVQRSYNCYIWYRTA